MGHDQFDKERNFLRNEIESIMEKSEENLKTERTIKARLARELTKTKELLEESEDMTYDLQSNVEKMRRAGTVQRLQFQLWRIKALSTCCKLRDTQKQETDRIRKESSEKDQKRISDLENQTRNKEKIINSFKETQNIMRDILVNRKRETLMQYKESSAILQSEMHSLAQAKAIAEKERTQSVNEISQLEGQVKELERQLRELSKVSAIQNGQVNLSHAKKKRLLDQNFEQLLDQASLKREQLALAENKIKDLSTQATNQESKLKELETHLVEILVQQQKKLLDVLSVNTA